MSPNLKWLLLLTCAAIFVATPAAARAHHYDHLLPKSGTCKGDRSPVADRDRRNRAVVCLANRARKRHGLKRLKTSSTLRAGARQKVNDIVRCETFSHDPCGQGPTHTYVSTGYGADGAENLGYGQRTAREAVSSWLHSAGHRAFILETGDWSGHGHEHVATWSRRHDGGIVWALAFGRSSTPGATSGPY